MPLVPRHVVEPESAPAVHGLTADELKRQAELQAMGTARTTDEYAELDALNKRSIQHG
jgi:hypothetical protein